MPDPADVDHPCQQQPKPAAQCVTPIPILHVFVSSPFKEWRVKGLELEDFRLRPQMDEAIRSAHCDTWLFEREGKQEQIASRLTDEQTIVNGIRGCHVLVAVVRSRSGSFLQERKSALHATFFELMTAMRYGKPVFLYESGRDWDEPLKRYLRVLGDSLFVAQHRRFPSIREHELVSAAVADVTRFRFQMARHFRPPSVATRGLPEDIGVTALDDTTQQIQQLTAASDFYRALQVAESVPVSADVRMNDREKMSYAGLLAEIAGVYANTLFPEKAIRAKKTSMRLCAQAGDLCAWFSRVQEVSGIYQMYGWKDAELWNSLALQGADREFGNLMVSCLDSRGSIFLNQSRFTEAAVALGTVVRTEKDPSPYNYIKWKTAEARRDGFRGIARARAYTEDEILPYARRSQRSLAYAIKGAARFAVWDRDYAGARPLLDEARQFCLENGLLHPLMELQQLSNACIANDPVNDP